MMRFVCDQMLSELGRWLRIAGYDTLIITAPDTHDKIPPSARKEHTEFWLCPACDHVFWHGSHTTHMLEQLKTWQHPQKLKD